MSTHPLADHPRPPPRGEDLPYDDGEPMETYRHRDQMNLLIDSLNDHQEDPTTFFAGGNMFVYFSETQAKNNDFRGPDVFVVLGRPQADLKSWVAWEQDGRLPDIVIELLSPKTEKIDRGVKMRIYRDIMKVSRYYLFDPWTYVFEGYALEDGAYVPIEPNAAGRLECRPLHLELGLREQQYKDVFIPRLRWFEPDGTLVMSAAEREDAERARADAEQARADALARRVAELEAKLEK